MVKENYKRIGILGGSFNPPHIAHLVNAQFVCEKLNLDKVFLMPSAIPPHVDEKQTIDSFHRLQMVKLAIENNDQLAIETYEIDQGGKNYTYNTIKALKEKYKNAQIYFIIGGDMVEYLPTWHRIDELVHEVNFVGINRIGYSLHTKYPIQFIEVPSIDISSSNIRQYILNKEPVRYLIADKVEKYIRVNGLYQQQSILPPLDEEKVKTFVSSQMSQKRFEHILRVEEKAIELAIKYNVNILACRWASLLHDLCKEWSLEQFKKVIDDYQLDINLLDWGSEILHGPVAKCIIPEMIWHKSKDELTDLEKDILDAIESHTIGSQQMSDVAKVLFIADYIEDGRNFNGVEKARALAEKSLDAAIKFKLEHTIKFLESKQVPIYPKTVEVYQYWINTNVNN